MRERIKEKERQSGRRGREKGGNTKQKGVYRKVREKKVDINRENRERRKK